jgi:hypothetical protein
VENLKQEHTVSWIKETVIYVAVVIKKFNKGHLQKGVGQEELYLDPTTNPRFPS